MIISAGTKKAAFPSNRYVHRAHTIQFMLKWSFKQTNKKQYLEIFIKFI